MWRKPNEEDKLQKSIIGRNQFDKEILEVRWNTEWNNWCLVENEHILILIQEVFSA